MSTLLTPNRSITTSVQVYIHLSRSNSLRFRVRGVERHKSNTKVTQYSFYVFRLGQRGGINLDRHFVGHHDTPYTSNKWIFTGVGTVRPYSTEVDCF